MTGETASVERPDITAMRDASSVLGALMAEAAFTAEPGQPATEGLEVHVWDPDEPELRSWTLCAGVAESEDGLLLGAIGRLALVEKVKGGVVGKAWEFVPVTYSFQSRQGAPLINAGRVRQVAIAQLAEQIFSAALEKWEADQPSLASIGVGIVSPELPSPIADELRAAWSVVVKGRSRDRRDYELLANAYQWLVVSGHHAPAAHLASVLGCSGSVLRNRLTKARSLGLTT